MSKVPVYLSIGSNVRPVSNIRAALRELRRQFGPLRVSPVYRSRAVGFSGDDFLNLVVGLETALRPGELVDRFRALEAGQGRVRDQGRFTSRTLDLDILTYGDQRIREGRLVIPRDEIIRYAFVLRPLADLAPDDHHPELGLSYAELWRRFDAADQPLEPFDLDAAVDDGAGD